jgi:hypothetical protein
MPEAISPIRLATAYKWKAQEYRDKGLSSAACVAESAFQDICKIIQIGDYAELTRKSVAVEVRDVLDAWNDEEGHGLQPDWLIALAGRIADRILSPPPPSLEAAAESLNAKLREEGFEMHVAMAEGEPSADLFVYCRYKKDVPKIPKAWKGYPVTVEFVGRALAKPI